MSLMERTSFFAGGTGHRDAAADDGPKAFRGDES